MLKRTPQYKFFKIWRKLQYAKFFLFKNFEFDHAYLIEMLILKLTMMGLQFAKFGTCVDEERKPMVRTIWAARQELKHFTNAWDITYAAGQKKFKERYGVEHEWGEMLTHPIDNKCVQFDGFELKSPVLNTSEEKAEAEAYWDKCHPYDSEYELQKASIKKAFAIIEENLFDWWD